jgi:hypothetical protein
MKKRMGTIRSLNQQGLTIFEISIIALIIMLIMVSTWVIISKVNHNTNSNYDKYNDVRLMNPSESGN